MICYSYYCYDYSFEGQAFLGFYSFKISQKFRYAVEASILDNALLFS